MPSSNSVASTAPTSPAVHSQTIPDGMELELTEFSRGIYVGVTGDLVVTLGNQDFQTTFTNVQAGAVYPFGVHTVHVSSATGLVAIF